MTAKRLFPIALALCVTALASRALAQAPLPPERPPEIGPSLPAAPTDAPAPTPVPPERLGDLAKPSAGAAPAAVPDAGADDTACRGRLDRLGVRWEALPPIADGVCGAARPLKVTALTDGVTLAPAVTTVCPVAEALARWATEVRVVAERDLGHAPRAYRIGGSYECRGQNHDPGAKLSDHARAAAVDVMGFDLESGATFTVAAKPEGTPEARALAEMRTLACDTFRTVLGPGADPQHANHFHLDLRERPKGVRLCE